jgi:hypothetical protein
MSRVSEALHERVRRSAKDRCGYCLSAQEYVLGQLEVEHILPTGQGGTDDEDNLWLACRLCNGYKGMQVDAFDPISIDRVILFNPRNEQWTEHFRWSDDGTRVIGLTKVGRATVEALQMNNPIAQRVRANWVTAGWHPPK